MNTKFKFWYEVHSGNQLMTEFMDSEEAGTWVKTCQMNIVAIQIVERMSKQEAMNYIRRIEE